MLTPPILMMVSLLLLKTSLREQTDNGYVTEGAVAGASKAEIIETVIFLVCCLTLYTVM